MKDKKTKVKKDKSSIGKKIIITLLLIILILAGVFGYYVYKNGGGLKGVLATLMGHNEYTVNNLDKFYCLVIGKSQNLTDTLILASYDPKNQTAAMLSIPRDTFIGEDLSTATSWDKINAIYQTENGPEELLKKVREITNVNVKNYIMVDTEALRVLVDAIGGVEFNVPIDMKYDDYEQGLHIDLSAGLQLLDGDKAEQVVRFRHNNNGTTYPDEYGTEDIGRMRTQRAFLKALAEKVLTWNSVTKVNNFIEIAQDYVETNIKIKSIKDYIPYAVEFNIDNLKTSVLPGVPEFANVVWVYIPNEEEIKEVVNNLFFDKETTTELEDNNVENEKTKIEIIDGTQDEEKVEEIRLRLENLGYEIVDVIEASSTAKTTIINRNNISENIMEHIKECVGEGIFSKGNSSEEIDVTIILGRDV